MKVLRLFSIVLALSLLLALPSVAQPQDGITVGLGTNINSQVITSSGDAERISLIPFAFSVPITTPSFRIDPEIGFFETSQSGGDFSRSRSRLTLGSGFYYASQYSEAQLLVGGRLGLTRRSFSVEGGGEERGGSATDFSIGPAIGGEYYFSDHLSAGVEARFMYVNLGSTDDAPDDTSASQLLTSGVASLRFHF